jgi:hypothetical protein
VRNEADYIVEYYFLPGKKLELHKYKDKNKEYFQEWNKLIKREIYEKTEFPQAGWAEDRVITIQTVYYAQKIGHIEEALYHHCTNEESITCNKT